MAETKKVGREPADGSGLETVLKSYAGRTFLSRGHDERFVLSEPSSEFGREVEKKKRLYNSFKLDDLIREMDSSFLAHDVNRIIGLEQQLLGCLSLLEETETNPLKPKQKKRVKSLLNHFHNWISGKSSGLQEQFIKLQYQIESNHDQSNSNRYVLEKLNVLDELAENYFFFAARNWLAGSLQVNPNSVLIQYHQLVQMIKIAEKGAWNKFAQEYSATTFRRIEEVENYQRYVKSMVEDALLSKFPGIPKVAVLRLEQSCHFKILNELARLRKSLDKNNQIKIFAQQSVIQIDRITPGIQNFQEEEHLRELRSRYQPLEKKFIFFEADFLYYKEAAGVYEKASRQLHDLIDQRIVQIVAVGDKEKILIKKPFLIRTKYFNVGEYLQGHSPRNDVLRQVQEVLSAQDGNDWAGKINQLGNLIKMPPSFYSTNDIVYLNEVVFALETSFREGILFSLSQDNAPFKKKTEALLTGLKAYTQKYASSIAA